MKTESKNGTRIELAENLELAVVVDERRLCARMSPASARLLARALLELAPPVSQRAGSALVGAVGASGKVA